MPKKRRRERPVRKLMLDFELWSRDDFKGFATAVTNNDVQTMLEYAHALIVSWDLDIPLDDMLVPGAIPFPVGAYIQAVIGNKAMEMLQRVQKHPGVELDLSVWTMQDWQNYHIVKEEGDEGVLEALAPIIASLPEEFYIDMGLAVEDIEGELVPERRPTGEDLLNLNFEFIARLMNTVAWHMKDSFSEGN